MLRITKHEVVLLAIDLDSPFSLGFGVLHHLPRVLVRCIGEHAGRSYEGVGEASIDFPFVDYDLWDVFWHLQRVQLAGREYPRIDAPQLVDENRRRRRNGMLPELPPQVLTEEECCTLMQCPAALTALTMACDDLWGRAFNVPLTALTTGPTCGVPMISIGFAEPATITKNARAIIDRGGIPKVKLGRDFQNDLRSLAAISGAAQADGALRPRLSADFNAAYGVKETMKLCRAALAGGIDLNIFITMEQPLAAGADQRAMAELRRRFSEELHWHGELVADESVVTVQDAQRAVRAGWRINYKMQKIGGIRQAMRIAQATRSSIGMVGGTFPTAIGRSYDLWAASALPHTRLPSDAWEPSTDWFSGPRHLICEMFTVDAVGQTVPFQGAGLGITVEWERVKRFLVADPHAEYTAIRTRGRGSSIVIDLKGATPYPELYMQKTGRDPGWNLT